MKEGISSIEYAVDWYGQDWLSEAISLNPDLAHLIPALENSPVSFLDLFTNELDLTEMSIGQVLISGGEGILNSIQLGLAELSGKLKEQIAALFLREKFGSPGDPLVSAVWAELAQREVLAIKDSKSNSIEIEKMLEQLKYQIVEKIKLAIAAEINQIEEQIRTYQEAQATSQEFADETPEIGEQLNTNYQAKFQTKFRQLKAKRKNLITIFKFINQLSFTEGQNQGKAVFEVARQTVSPTLLAA